MHMLKNQNHQYLIAPTLRFTKLLQTMQRTLTLNKNSIRLFDKCTFYINKFLQKLFAPF
eukprot:UN03654